MIRFVKIIISIIILILIGNEIYAQNKTKMELATFGSGCFWCSEAIFSRLNGLESVTSGYSGGEIENPTYKQVCEGETGHAEVIQIKYNPEIISYTELLEVFWQTHDPTTLNRQGTDVGTQYRSVIFYHNEEQKKLAETFMKKLNDEKIYDKPVVTEITQFDKFYKAENYHQDYYEYNRGQGYCNFVITPKIEKFKKVFKNKLRK